MQMIREESLSPDRLDRASVMLAKGQDWTSALPKNATARIWRPSKSATTAGRAQSRAWKMTFPRLSAPWIEPLMGWTAGDDIAYQIELSFPTLDAAIRHAERLGVPYEVRLPPGEAARRSRRRRAEQAVRFSDATLARLGLSRRSSEYRRAMAGASERNDPVGGLDPRSPMEIVCDPLLGPDAKRSILMNWAYSEYLEDLASSEGMPENGRISRLAEIERALFALETGKLARAIA